LDPGFAGRDDLVRGSDDRFNVVAIEVLAEMALNARREVGPEVFEFGRA
jgi:hypothetical protein